MHNEMLIKEKWKKQGKSKKFTFPPAKNGIFSKLWNPIQIRTEARATTVFFNMTNLIS